MTWDTVPQTCAGAPEAIAGFIVFLWAFRLLGWVSCEAEGGWCPVYASSGWQEVARVEEPYYADPTPPAGSVFWWRIEQVDEVGNTSEDCR